MSKQPKEDPKKFVRGGRAGRGPGRVRGMLRPFGVKPNSSGYGKGPPEPPKSRGGWLWCRALLVLVLVSVMDCDCGEFYRYPSKGN